MTQSIELIGIVGTGVMGTGIAQVAAQAGYRVMLYDARAGAAQAALQQLTGTFDTLVSKNKIGAGDAEAALARLSICTQLDGLGDCDLVIEAIVENLDAKQGLLRALEQVVAPTCLLATNTSSLSVTRIASVCEHPQRVAGLHFFNPVPLMKVIEVIDGLATDPLVTDSLQAFATRLGHRGIRAKDSPGFIINHAGRAYGTEALQILKEGVACPADIDRILREGMGFRMGPFELFDLTALDVSHPVNESIYHQFYEDPRYRPSSQTQRMVEAGFVGRKVGRGFYRYPEAPVQPAAEPTPQAVPPVWVGAQRSEDRVRLLALLLTLGAEVETAPRPSANALCLLAPYGIDAAQACLDFDTPPSRTVCIDLLPALDRHRTLMPTLATLPAMVAAARTLLSRDGVGVTVISDSVGFVAQRVMAMIVNLAGEIVQQQIASVEDLEEGVRRGLGYPYGPLAWGDALGAGRLLLILTRMCELTADPRYRPGLWLRRRAGLGLGLGLALGTAAQGVV
ncbi:3-hydroxyacyl-CoA dehydrogenase [Pseudomonas sp. TE3610]